MASEAQRRDRAIEHVFRTIDRSRASWRLVEVLAGSLKTFLAVGDALLIGFVLDNLFHLPGPVRLAYAVAVLGILTFMLLRFILYPLVRPMTDEMVAAHLERAFPELDNSVINAVLLSRERFRDSLTRHMAASQVRQTAESVRKRDFGRPTGGQGLWKSGRWALGLVGAAVLYGALFSDYMGNAFLRFVFPYRYIPPITDTRLEVSPGDADCLQGDSLRIEARVSGLLPESASIHAETAGAERSADTMPFEGNAFTYEYANVQRDFTYRIKAGDASTRLYTVTVRDRPSIEDLTLEYRYPAYTGLPDRTETNAPGDIRAPVGTAVRLTVRADRPLSRSHVQVRHVTADAEGAAPQELPLVRAGPNVVRQEIRIERSGQYTIHLFDADGISNIPQVRQIEAVPDAPPNVVFVEPARDVAVAPDAKVSLLASAEDDFGLRELHLFVQPRAGADWEPLRNWQYEGGMRAAREGCVIDVQEMGLGVGTSLAYYMQANDGLRREGEGIGRSRVYHIRVVDAAVAGRTSDEVRQALVDVIKELIRLQEANLAATRAVGEWGAGQEQIEPEDEHSESDFGQRAGQLVAQEEAIYTGASAAVTAYTGQDGSRMVEALGRIAAGPVARAIGLLKELERAPDAESVPPRAEEAAAEEAHVVELLKELLEDPAAALARVLREEEGSEELAERMEDLTSGEQLAERLLKSLGDFRADQERVIELSNALGDTPVDDFTDEDEGKLQDILETEKKWAKFFQEAATDLSKLPPQDHSLATQAQEFLEVYSEIQQAIEEAERQAIEMAVPHEQAGAELAEQIETNLEKWLMETKDNQLWSMEDPMEDYEVPLAELPDELQDLIGDLVEEEEDMLEQFDDVTSAWFDSLDIGAGWDTMDGPISNMSAKGVTGNRLPNTQEVGGRSGEGRTGKSSGQFVEEVATGKGGRQTPTRLTPDPFEAGWVQDLSAEAPTGATGGGKVSGQGAEGFQGPGPPPLQQRLKRMAVRQGELIGNARRLDYGLKKYRHPRGKLPETIELMEAQQAALEEAEISTFGKYQRTVLTNLREIKELSEIQKQLWRDRSALLPKQLRQEIASAQSEQVPEQYREMVRNYFRALSEAGTARR